MKLFIPALAILLLTSCDINQAQDKLTSISTKSDIKQKSKSNQLEKLEELRKRANDLYTKGQFYWPKSDNASELFLQIVKQDKDNKGQDSKEIESIKKDSKDTLVELSPYIVVSTEVAIEKGDFDKAEYLISLLKRIDKNTPALPRLEKEISTKYSTYNPNINQDSASQES